MFNIFLSVCIYALSVSNISAQENTKLFQIFPIIHHEPYSEGHCHSFLEHNISIPVGH